MINADAAGRKLSLMIYLCTLLTVGLVTALAGAVLFSYVAQQTQSAAAGLVAALAYGLATPTWEWATSFFGHAPAGALLIIGFVLLERLPRESAWNKRKIALTLLAGAALGAAITVEFTAAIAVAILIVYYSAQGFTFRRESRATALDVLAIGATIGLMQIPLLIYNNAIFGSPFHLGYSNVVGFNGMKSGFFGINAPNPVRAVANPVQLLSRRGLAFARARLRRCGRLPVTKTRRRAVACCGHSGRDADLSRVKCWLCLLGRWRTPPARVTSRRSTHFSRSRSACGTRARREAGGTEPQRMRANS